MRLTSDLIISALALLLVLAGALWLPLVGAGTSDMNVALSVVEEGGGGGGGGGGLIQPPAPPPEEKPPAIFQLVDYVPKVIPYYRDSVITFYGRNFPASFQIMVKGADAVFVTDYTPEIKKASEAGALDSVQYVFPAKSLPRGEAVLRLQRNGQPLTTPLPVLVYDWTQPINLRAQIAQRTINVTVASGQSANVTIKFKNIGLTEWDYLLQPLHIGTDRPHDRQSRFVHKDWPYNNRAARISLPTGIETGETFNATFSIQAPVVKRTTRYTENFALVAEGVAWIPSSNFTVRITVIAPAVAKAAKVPAAVTKPAAPYKIFNTVPVTAVKSGGWWSGVKSFFAQVIGLLGALANNLLK